MTLQPLPSTATTTSEEIWSILTSTYAKPSREHVKQIRQQIQNWKKGAKSIYEYYQGFTTRFDELVLLGKALSNLTQLSETSNCWVLVLSLATTNLCDQPT